MLITPGIRGSVITRGMEDYLGRSQETLVEVEELETYLLRPTDVAGSVNVLAKNACNHNGHRRFVFLRRKDIWWQP